ncbi:MAG: HNH endonuclease signature motif containing protein [Salipiger marinus]|uniref:HNH endonuclease signature motif containing protein n=1 Tax=Salipiger marinus TaxID=555512 RepID=UPI0040587ABB
MPSRGPRICGCGRRVDPVARCECEARRKAERDKRHDAKRGNSSQRGYGGTWERLAARWKKGKLCAWPGCDRGPLGSPAKAEHVDHIIPHRHDPALRDDPKNWQGLCAHHHNSAKQRLERRSTKRN